MPDDDVTPEPSITPETAVAAQDVGEPVDERHLPARWIRRLVLGLIIVRIVMAYVGDFAAPGLTPNPEKGVKGSPLLVMMFNTRKRFLLLAKDVAFLPYFAVAMIGQLLTDPLYYMVGRWYGDAGIRWAERKFGDSVTQMEKLFASASKPMVAIAPNNIICLMAGASGMKPRVFFPLNIGGTLVAVLLARWVGDAFSEPLDKVFAFIGRFRWQLMALSFALIAYQLWDQRRKGRSQIEGIDALESELEDAKRDVNDPQPPA
ncbi:MAG TPA: hypothetical protein VMY34_05095 [Acidimicrobiales bacterium]|nr:hypothetical protein [Acidimicrobiales bacterium]